MLGFDRVFGSQTSSKVSEDLTVPLVTIPLYALLKLVAYSDRLLARDPAGVLHCLIYYEEDSERLYGIEDQGRLIEFDLASAYLLGLDSRPLLDDLLAEAIKPTLATLTDPDSSLAFGVAREYGRGMSNEVLREQVGRLFKAYAQGLRI